MKKISYTYYAYSFFFQFLFWVPIFYEIQKRAGLTETEIFRIQSFYYFGYFLFEIPTGLLADRIGSRACLLLGGIVLAAANAVPVFSMEYWPFLIHFIGIALARSLLSGAGSAWIYALLKKEGMADQFRFIEGKARSAGLFGRLISWPFAPLVMGISLQWPYVLSTAAAVCSLLAALYMPRDGVVANGARRSVLQDLKSVGGALKNHQLILPAMLQGVGVFVLMRVVLVNLYNPLMTGSGVAVAHLGLVMSLVTGAEALVSANQERFLKGWDPVKLATILTMLLAVTVLCMASLNYYASIALIMVFSGLCGLIGPVQKQFLNDVIDIPELRASPLSVESLIDRLICGVVVLPLGGLVATGFVNLALVYSAFAVMIFQLFSHMLIRRRRAR